MLNTVVGATEILLCIVVALVLATSSTLALISAAHALTVPGCYAAACHVSILSSPGLFVERCTCGLSRVRPHEKLKRDWNQKQRFANEGNVMPHALTQVGLLMVSPTIQGENLAFEGFIHSSRPISHKNELSGFSTVTSAFRN